MTPRNYPNPAEHNLVLLSNSGAHYLRDIGRCYTEISLEDFCRVGPP